MEKKYFPLFIDLNGVSVLIVGGGNIATRRLETLLKFNARITVIAIECSNSIYELVNSGCVELEQREYKYGDVDKFKLVLATTNNEEVNNYIYEECKSKAILVNTAHDKSKSDFYFPAIIEEDNFVIGITANGNDHKGVKQIAEKIRSLI